MRNFIAIAMLALFCIGFVGTTGCDSMCEKYADKWVECAKTDSAKTELKNHRKKMIDQCEADDKGKKRIKKCLDISCSKWSDCLYDS